MLSVVDITANNIVLLIILFILLYNERGIYYGRGTEIGVYKQWFGGDQELWKFNKWEKGGDQYPYFKEGSTAARIFLIPPHYQIRIKIQ